MSYAPGAAARLGFQPADTGVRVGGSVALRAAVLDRYGNRRTDPVTYETSASGITVTPTGQVSGVSTGRYAVRARAADRTDSGYVAVVPQGVLAVAVVRDSGGVAMLNLDGTGYQWLGRSGPDGVPWFGYGTPAAPTWAGDGSVVYVRPEPSGSANALYSVTLDLIEVSTGRTIPLRYLSSYTQPAWKP